MAAKTTKTTKNVKKPVANKPKKINLADVKKGSMVGEIHKKTVEFVHNGEQMSVDIKVQTLPFGVTESLLKRWNNDEDVVAEWISKALVDDEGNQQFTEEEVDKNFVQGMAAAIFDEVWGAENIKKKMELAKLKQDVQLASMKLYLNQH